jgi:hypothetical protein
MLINVTARSSSAGLFSTATPTACGTHAAIRRCSNSATGEIRFEIDLRQYFQHRSRDFESSSPRHCGCETWLIDKIIDGVTASRNNWYFPGDGCSRLRSAAAACRSAI